MLIRRWHVRTRSTGARRAPFQGAFRGPVAFRLRRALPVWIALFLLVPAAAIGAVAVDLPNISSTFGTANTLTWSHTTSSADQLLLATISTRSGSTVTSVNYGAQGLTFLGAQNNSNNAVRIEMWYLLRPLTGTRNIVVSLSSSASAIGIATPVTGANLGVPLVFQSLGSTGGGSTTPGLTVASAPGSLVIDSVSTQANVTSYVQGPLQSKLFQVRNGTAATGSAQVGSSEPGAASVAMSWTLNLASFWAIGAVSIPPAVTISGRVFEDADFSGAASDYDGGTGDAGLPNVDVELYDAADAYLSSATTAADGSYSIPGVSNGTYKVRVRSATIGDANTPPRGGLNGSVPGTWPYPLPELAWANGAALYGGQSPAADDTATGDNLGPGDTFTTVTVNSADVLNVNFGFAYNLIVHAQDDNTNDSSRSGQGSIRQFIKNANAIGQANGTTASSSQFRMQVPANQSVGADSWWRLTVANRDLPALADAGSVLDGSTQRLNSGIDSNALGPEIEITGFGTSGTAIGLRLTGTGITVRELNFTSFSLNGIRIDSANGLVEGCYVGINAIGTAALPIGEDGILINGSNNIIGGGAAAQRNVISGNIDEGIDINPGFSGNVVIGNYIGTNASATAAIPNGSGVPTGGVIVGGNSNRIGGPAPGEGNVICGNADAGIRLSEGGSGNMVYGNFIGTTPAGTATLGNASAGVLIEAGAANSVIGGSVPGEQNIIAYNGGDGVFVTGSGTDGNVISGNSIFENAGLGIDLAPDGVGDGGGANNDKARPVITSATPSGSDYLVGATAASGDSIEFFRVLNAASPAVAPDPTGSGEGYLYLGRCVDNGACSGPFVAAAADGDAAAGAVQATILAAGAALGDSVSATAADAANGTSEFSVNRMLPVSLAIVKQAWLVNGSAPLASPFTAPVGSTVVFLIYVRNTSALDATDVRISDLLDESAFEYLAGSLVRTLAAAPPADTATDLEIFSATAPAIGTNLSDAVDGDAASALDTNANTFVDRMTVGAAAGQANGAVDIASHTVFAVRFAVLVR